MNTRIGFNAGEFSPSAACRADLDNYHRGCSSILNMQIMQMGGVRRRRGMEKACKALSEHSRLFSFVFNDSEVFILEFAPGVVRTLKNGVEMWRGVSPWDSEKKVRNIRIQQLNDVVYCVCKGVAPRVLKRCSDENWAIEAMPMRKEPWLSLAAKSEKMTILQVYTAGRVMRAHCSSPVFAGALGRRICVRRRVNAQPIRFSADSSVVPVKGAWSLTTTGEWYGTYRLYRYFDGREELYKEFSSMVGSPSNFTFSGDEEDLIYMRCFLHDSQGNQSVIHLNVSAFYYDHIGTVSEVFSDNEANITYDDHIEDVSALTSLTVTPYWSYSAFSDESGYPSSIGFHQGRLWLAGTSEQPQTIWASAVDDFDNFELKNEKADAAMQFRIASASQNEIRWIEPLRGLCSGTSEGEWILTGKDGVIDAETASFNRQSNVGSCNCDALSIENGLVYIQRDGKRLRQYAYSLEADGFMSEDLTVFADHILKAGVKEMTYQRSPEPVLWCVLQDGKVACMTYNMVQNVKAWGRFETAGEVKSIATLPCADGAGDEVWFVVVRDGVAWLEVSRDSSPLLDHAEKVGEAWQGVEFISEVVTNGIDVTQTLGKQLGAAQVSACFVNTPSHGLLATNDGGKWVSCGLTGTLEGWHKMTVSGSWETGLKVGLRASGQNHLEVLAVQIIFNK